MHTHTHTHAAGGIGSSGDIVKCFAAGASGVMLGSMLAGTDESPGQVVVANGGKKYKTIRGMGSRAAMAERSGSRDRYNAQSGKHATEALTQQQREKMVPEGVEGLVELRGSVEKLMTELVGGVRSGFAHSGAADVATFQRNAKFWRQSTSGIIEGNPHSITDIRN